MQLQAFFQFDKLCWVSENHIVPFSAVLVPSINAYAPLSGSIPPSTNPCKSPDAQTENSNDDHCSQYQTNPLRSCIGHGFLQPPKVEHSSQTLSGSPLSKWKGRHFPCRCKIIASRCSPVGGSVTSPRVARTAKRLIKSRSLISPVSLWKRLKRFRSLDCAGSSANCRVCVEWLKLSQGQRAAW